MNDKERLQLSKMIKANDVENVTDSIREKKHSSLIEKDIAKMVRLKREFSHLNNNPSQIDLMLETQCPFLFVNYTDIFNRLKKDELSLDIMAKFLHVLKKIENSDIDQHEGAFLIGKYLKEIYIDSALQRGEKLDEKFSKTNETKELPKNISWTQFKHMKNNK